MNILKIIEKISLSLSPDLLKACYKEENSNNPMFGHCYVASEVLFHILEAEYPGRFHPSRGKDDRGIVHWWITDRTTGKIIDITANQYFSVGKSPPYDKAVKCSFLTKQPSKRAKKLMSKICL
jgi:hypothetical protein